MTIIRAGKLDRIITLERATITADAYGATQEKWTCIATVAAQLVQSTAREFIRDFGASGETTCVFRIRYDAELTLADRVTYAGKSYDVKEIREIVRRRGLELRCVQQA